MEKHKNILIVISEYIKTKIGPKKLCRDPGRMPPCPA